MVPNKFETEIKEKLKAREIEPSPMAWDKLDTMLSSAENKKRKRNFKWLYIAASIIGFVFFSMLFLDERNTKIDANSNNQTMVQADDPLINPSQKSQTIKKSSITTIEEVATSIKKRTVISETKNQPLVAVSEKKNEKNNSKVKEQPLLKTKKSDKEAILVENHSEKSKTEGNIIKENQNVLVSSNVDKTLAENVNAPEATQKKATLKIDPNALLSEVDGEIKLSFRQKVMKEVVKKFPVVREALVNRNQQ
jgi:hypothetical protein